MANPSKPDDSFIHPDLRQTARVRAFMQHVGDGIAAHLERLATD